MFQTRMRLSVGTDVVITSHSLSITIEDDGVPHYVKLVTTSHSLGITI